jgi:O-methyltransferase involved in polyketide biosynthesis
VRAGKAVGRTLARLAAFAAGSRIAITYDLPAQALTGLQREVRDSLAALVSDLGEPFTATFERNQAQALLTDGLRQHQPLQPLRRGTPLLRGTKRYPGGGSQRLLTATVASTA